MMGETVHIQFMAGTKEECFDLFSTKLRFPAYFSKNWDGFWDCLTDLSWFNEPPRIELNTSTHAFDNARDQQMFDTMLREASAHFEKEHSAFMKVIYT